jgi:hypothetical protein
MVMHCWVLLLQEEQLPPALQQELSQLEQFCCGSFYGQRVEPLRAVSYRSYQEELRWVAGPVSASRPEVQQQLLAFLHIAHVVPSSHAGLPSCRVVAGTGDDLNYVLVQPYRTALVATFTLQQLADKHTECIVLAHDWRLPVHAGGCWVGRILCAVCLLSS